MLARLRWPLRRAVTGKDPGGWRARNGGDGLEIETVREYSAGDDVRRINWTAAARTGQLQVVVPVAERALTSRIVLDASGSMSFGSTVSKFQVAVEAVETLNRIASRHADRVQVLAVGEQVQPGAAHQGRAAVIAGAALLERISANGTGPLASTIVDRTTGRGELLIVVSDFRDPAARDALRRTCRRGPVLAVVVHDPHERSLPDVGPLSVRDPETGEQLRVDTSDRALRAAFETAAERARIEIQASAAGAIGVLDLCTAGAHGGMQVVQALLGAGKVRR